MADRVTLTTSWSKEHGSHTEEFRVLEYPVVKEILLSRGPQMCTDAELKELVFQLAKHSGNFSIGQQQHEIVIRSFQMPKDSTVLPPSIRQLKHLTTLSLQGSKIDIVPSFIGTMQNLECLNLSWRDSTTDLPEEIGDLANLKTLNLDSTMMYSLPSSIGRLKKLENLSLLNASMLMSLPEEIGELVSLKTLSLDGTRHLKSLPPSIGRLTKLEYFFLCRQKELTHLPEEIGSLCNLKIFLLYSADGPKSLPRSIGRWKNLEELKLYSQQLVDLPEEIGDLLSLKKLDLRGSRKLTSLPRSIGRLKKLEILDLEGTKELSNLPQEIGDLASLKTLRLDTKKMLTLPGRKQLCFALDRRRRRCRTHEAIARSPNLWPLVLENATRAGAFQFLVGTPLYRRNEGIVPQQQQDAIYQQLLDNRQSFLQCLMNRGTPDSTYS